MANSGTKLQGFSLASNKHMNSIKAPYSANGGGGPDTSMKSKKTYLIVNHSSNSSFNTNKNNRQSNHKESSDLIKRILRA